MTPASPSTLVLVRNPLFALAAVCLGLAMVALSGCNSSDNTAAADAGKTAAGGKELTTAQEVLEAMAAAYQGASSYSDAGSVRLAAEVGDKKIDDKADFAVSLVRPNKLRLDAYQATVVCDGEQMRANLLDLPEQVVEKPAPTQLTLSTVYCDPLLVDVVRQGFASFPPQLILLLEKDPLKAFLRQAETPVLTEPGEIDGRKFYRVRYKRPDGKGVFWIDQETLVLRRIEVPTDELHNMLAQQGTVKSLSLVADFEGARLNEKVDAKAFAWEQPKGAEVVKFLIPPHPAQLLGKKVPDFKFYDLDGKEVTPQSLAGKIAVLDFWATWCGPCRQSLPNLEKVYQHYKNDEKIAFLAVSVDQPETENQAVAAKLKELGTSVPIVRDTDQHVGRTFKTTGIPSTFILDAKGVVQDYEVGGNPDMVEVLPQKLEKLLAGQNIYQKGVADYQKELKNYEQTMEKQAAAAESGQETQEQEIPRAAVAARSEPKALRLTPLWKCTQLQAPGNILVVEEPKQPPRILVIEGWKAAAELDVAGKVLGVHPLKIDDREFVTTLRTTVAADGKRYYAGFANGQQRLHVFDAKWTKLCSFPEDALENKHDGIGDVQFGDLDGDGVPELYVGYWGAVGVHAVSLDGKLLHRNRSISWVMRVAVTGPDAQRRRQLFCINNTGSLVAMDARLEKQGEVSVPDRLLQWIVAGDLSGDGVPLWCGMVAPRLGDNVAIGINLRGEELWNYTLPEGVHPQPIERIIPGKLSSALPGQWLLPGPDGSIHVVAADGKPIDRFNYGVPLHGLATADLDGKPTLLIASPGGVEALRVE